MRCYKLRGYGFGPDPWGFWCSPWMFGLVIVNILDMINLSLFISRLQINLTDKEI
jgi:hypothetical protein